MTINRFSEPQCPIDLLHDKGCKRNRYEGEKCEDYKHLIIKNKLRAESLFHYLYSALLFLRGSFPARKIKRAKSLHAIPYILHTNCAFAQNY